MDKNQIAIEAHKAWQGKIEIISRASITNREELAIAYTPGVAAACLEIEKNPELSYELTRRKNLVAVITDGTAVLGLGDIGPLAAMPVMEGKCALFKEFAGVDAFPICLDTKDPDEIVKTIALISKSFGGINLEDISAPRCFEIEKRLNEILDIPVFHDDQHGTAIVVGAALINAIRLSGKNLKDITVVVNGAGAAGIAITEFLMLLEIGNIIVCDINGILHNNADMMNIAQKDIASRTNKNNVTGDLNVALCGADVFIGVSKPNLVTKEMVMTMNEKPIIFSLANPTPEIMPEEALAGGAFIVGTGRSDYPNQINNVLAFPGIFKGALSCRANVITNKMKLAAAKAIADIIKDEIRVDYIIPDAFDKRVAEAVASSVINEYK